MIDRRAISINQPSLFPWIGEFEKLASVSQSISLDSVKYQKSGFLTRCRLVVDGRAHWLTIPTNSVTRHGVISEVELLSSTLWHNKTISSLKYWYRKAPFATDMIDVFAECTRRVSTCAVDLAEESLTQVYSYLGLPFVTRIRSSNFAVTSTGSHLVRDFVIATHSNHYVFGPGSKGIGSHYLNRSLFQQSGITLEVMDYEDAHYDQGGGPFVRRCSVLDAIAWHGMRTAELIVSKPHVLEGH